MAVVRRLVAKMSTDIIGTGSLPLSPIEGYHTLAQAGVSRGPVLYSLSTAFGTEAGTGTYTLNGSDPVLLRHVGREISLAGRYVEVEFYVDETIPDPHVPYELPTEVEVTDDWSLAANAWADIKTALGLTDPVNEGSEGSAQELTFQCLRKGEDGDPDDWAILSVFVDTENNVFTQAWVDVSVSPAAASAWVNTPPTEGYVNVWPRSVRVTTGFDEA